MRVITIRKMPMGAMMLAGLVMAVAASSPAQARTAEEILLLKGPDRQQILLKGAKKEGTMTWYSALTVNQALRPVVNAFMKKYPFIKVEYWRGSSRKIVQKVMAESRANALAADLLSGSGLSQPFLKAKAVLPYYTPSLKDYPSKYRDPKGYWGPTRFSYMGTAYNTKMLKKSDVPKTFEALLDPKWKGKLSWRANSESGALLFITNARIAMGEKKAEAYLKKLSKQKIINFRGSARTLVNRVVEGEYPLALNIFMHHPIISARKGAPVASMPMAPVPAIISTLMIPRGLKHPHAAMLMVDYFLSKEGQSVLRKANYFPSHPKVGPKKHLRSIMPAHTGLKENFVSPEILYKYRKGSKALFKKYFR